MSKHVAPERWADLAAGRVSDAERAALEAHAAACEPCRGARGRVEQARRAMDAIADGPVPALNWETLGARIHWSVSSDLRRREREQEGRAGWTRRLFPLSLGGAVVAAAAAGVWYLVLRTEPTAPKPELVHRDPVQEVIKDDLKPAPEPAPAAAPLEGVVILAQGKVAVDGAPASLDAPLRAGSRIVAEDDGRIAVQFGDRSGFVVEPGTTVELVAFDAEAVELRVAGAITCEVTKRDPGQRFAVVAGGRRVEVRGTVFRVAQRGDELDVTVTRGRVAVIEADAEVEVPAGQRLALPVAARLAGRAPRAFTPAEEKQLADRMRVPMLPAWQDPAAARAGSSIVSIAAAGGVRVSLDGVALGAGSVVVRTAPGRHLVEVGGRKKWVEVGAGARADAAVAPPRGGGERAAQFQRNVTSYRQRLEGCAKGMRSVDAEWRGEMVIEIEIGADGSVRSVVATRGLKSRETENCILDVIRDHFTFPPGTPETISQPIGL